MSELSSAEPSRRSIASSYDYVTGWQLRFYPVSKRWESMLDPMTPVKGKIKIPNSEYDFYQTNMAFTSLSIPKISSYAFQMGDYQYWRSAILLTF